MNAYTTQGQARIRQRDIATILRTDAYLAGGSLEALERQREGQAVAEVTLLLKQCHDKPQAVASLVSTLQQTIGAVLVRAGLRLAGAPRTNATAEMAAMGTPGVTTARP